MVASDKLDFFIFTEIKFSRLNIFYNESFSVENGIVERKDDSLWFDIFKNHESNFKLHKVSSNGWAKLTSREPKNWMAQARRPCWDSQPHSVLPRVLCSSLHFLSRRRETNLYLVLTTCCARESSTGCLFHLQCVCGIWCPPLYTEKKGPARKVDQTMLVTSCIFIQQTFID